MKLLKLQRRLAARILKSGERRIKFDSERLSEIQEAITAIDIKNLIKKKVIVKVQKKGHSRSKARKIKEQKSKGRRKGAGSREGTRTARLPRKKAWMAKVRSQRKYLRVLKEKQLIDNQIYRNIYRKIGGGYFRSKRHIQLYLNEHNLFKSKK